MSIPFFLMLLVLLPGVFGFKVTSGPSWNHQEITEKAILDVTLHACRAVAEAEGWSFIFPTLVNAENVLKACAAQESARAYAENKETIKNKNVRVDILYFWSPKRHFDNELFIDGKKIITDGLYALKASIKKDNFPSARETLGVIFHTLQDFYSHSNWIEMGNDRPNSNLISGPDSPGKIAAKTRPTCRDCDGDDCNNNILQDILDEKILTSGYFSFLPFKPKGKCSHGNLLDATASFSPRGGINKDCLENIHGDYHNRAANVAIAATFELLNDVRGAAGDKDFLRMLGVVQGKALCFVIDTTGSMGDDIAAVRTATTIIINKRLGTKDEPSVYVLVPFNDPDFGPRIRTTDADEFKKAINALSPHDGGDSPEMSLSGLQLALTGTPPNSEIYVFTDDAAKDAHLRNAVTALVERTGSVVYFMRTYPWLHRQRSNSPNDQKRSYTVYKDLAVASGGQAVEVSKSQLLEAMTAVLETSSSSVVTLLQAVRDSGKSENFAFTVDDTVRNLTIYITGINKDFTVVSPSGESQESTATNGSLIMSRVFVGNLRSVTLTMEVGQWELRIRSTSPYSLKITGQTPIDFFFNFLQPAGWPFEGYIALENRPKAGANGTMMVTLLGSASAVLTEVSLVYLSGSGVVNGTISGQDNGEYLVQFHTIPSQQFNVVVKGQSGNSFRSIPTTFQRQSTTSFKASTVSITANEENIVTEPGSTLSVNFTISTDGSGGTFIIRATNDQGFSVTFPSTVVLESNSSVEATLQLTAPNDAESGTEVTLTIDTESPDGDVNYVVLSITVLEEVTDITRPVCELVSLSAICSGVCDDSSWQLSVRLSDGVNGTGLDRVYLRQGNGAFNTSLTADNDTIATYEASCCSPTVEIVAVDGVGNVGSCTFTAETTKEAPLLLLLLLLLLLVPLILLGVWFHKSRSLPSCHCSSR